ncbi:Calmodulin binding protein-like [Heracleum sosnowskyi]|uniref:Calmodulin binding protein-like n=1 Tax=Heracleum sosnowskyi TaxID=360622 RepID=A0AAD8M342_9APIA|nr:Calmodulin binding protein-like [Heracleum sosnowskyi]
MSGPGQLQQPAAAVNMDLQHNSTSEDDDLTTISGLRKERLELLIVRTLERVIVPVMGDLVRKVVKEEIELVQENVMRCIPCSLSTQGSTCEPRRCLHLMLQNVKSPVRTSSKIEGEGGTSIKVALVDSLSGEVVKTGPEAAAEVEILVLKGDYSGHEGCNGKLEDFNNRIVREMEGKKSLLQGTTTLKLKQGISSIDNISFTQNSHWMRNSKLCLGARAVNFFPGITIEPAKTESFDLKDNRTKAYAKKDVPSLLDKVSRLRHIGKGRRTRLKDNSIYTVKDLLVLLNTNPQRLQKILKVRFKIWEEITDHAKTCIIDEEVYMYIDRNLQQKSGVVFDVIGQVKGVLKESQYLPMNMLPDTEQKNAQKLVVSAFNQWEDVSRYDDENSLMESLPHILNSTMIEIPSPYINQDSLFDTCEQAGISSYGNRTSNNCTRESIQMGSPEKGLSCPVYSSPLSDEILQFLNFDDQPERLIPELNPKLLWKRVICVIRVSRCFSLLLMQISNLGLKDEAVPNSDLVITLSKEEDGVLQYGKGQSSSGNATIQVNEEEES